MQVGPQLQAEALCGAVLGNFVLFGTDKCLYAIDSSLPFEKQRFIVVIHNVRFRKLEVIEDYGVLLAISGKNNHVRSYRLNSLKKLISYVFGIYIPSRDQKQLSQHSLASDNSLGGSRELYQVLHNGTSKLSDEAWAERWRSDFVKLPATKDSTSFVVERTVNSIFVGVLFNHAVTLFQWAAEPYLKFLKVKDFWLPATPKIMALLHDGSIIREIFLSYQIEGNFINVQTGQVTEVLLDSEFSNQKGFQWESYDQLPLRRKPLPQKPTQTVSRKIRWANAQTIDSEVLPPPPARRMLATYGNTSRIVSLEGKPQSQFRIQWSKVPDEMLILKDDELVYSFIGDRIEVGDLRTGDKTSVGLASDARYIGTRADGNIYVCTYKKKKSSYLFRLERKELREKRVSVISPMSSSADLSVDRSEMF